MKVLFSDGSELGFGHGFDTPAEQVAWVLGVYKRQEQGPLRQMEMSGSSCHDDRKQEKEFQR